MSVVGDAAAVPLEPRCVESLRHARVALLKCARQRNAYRVIEKSLRREGRKLGRRIVTGIGALIVHCFGAGAELQAGAIEGLGGQHINGELEVASGTTASQLLEVDLVKELSSEFPKDYKIGVNSELLDGEFRPTPEKYRLKEGERVEIYRMLNQDPKERRRKNV